MEINDSSNDDLLSLLLESNNEVHENQKRCKDIRLTIEDIIEECKLFYFAGYETTAVLLTWTMVALSMHPNWQEHAREEVLQVFGKHSPDNEGLNRLKIVYSISYLLNETLKISCQFLGFTCIIHFSLWKTKISTVHCAQMLIISPSYSFNVRIFFYHGECSNISSIAGIHGTL